MGGKWEMRESRRRDQQDQRHGGRTAHGMFGRDVVISEGEGGNVVGDNAGKAGQEQMMPYCVIGIRGLRAEE